MNAVSKIASNSIKTVETLLSVVLHPRRALRHRRLIESGISPEDFETYNRPWLRNLDFNLILDVGAARGGHTKLFRKLFPDANIVAFEPLPQNFARLQQSVRDDPRVTCCQVAISDTSGHLDFYTGGESFLDSSSLLEMSVLHKTLWSGSQHRGKITVDSECLDNLIALKRSDRVLIKMDIQGAELKAVNGGLKTIGAAKCLILEVSLIKLYEGCPRFDELCVKLHSLGLRFAGMLSQQRDPTGLGNILQCDAIFVNDTER